MGYNHTFQKSGTFTEAARPVLALLLFLLLYQSFSLIFKLGNLLLNIRYFFGKEGLAEPEYLAETLVYGNYNEYKIVDGKPQLHVYLCATETATVYTVTYTGDVMESFPAQVNAVSWSVYDKNAIAAAQKVIEDFFDLYAQGRYDEMEELVSEYVKMYMENISDHVFGMVTAELTECVYDEDQTEVTFYISVEKIDAEWKIREFPYGLTMRNVYRRTSAPKIAPRFFCFELRPVYHKAILRLLEFECGVSLGQSLAKRRSQPKQRIIAGNGLTPINESCGGSNKDAAVFTFFAGICP